MSCTLANAPATTMRRPILVCVVQLCALWSIAAAHRKNVLLLVADDLRPQLHKAYGQSEMVTPHLDQFSDEALVFDHAYTNFGICSASRNSFLSGRRPDFTRTWNFINHFRQAGISSSGRPGSDWVTLPELFKQANYTTLGHGKLYHPNKPPRNDEPYSWSQEQPYVPLTVTECKHARIGERFCPEAKKPNNAFSDYNTTMSALDTLRKYGKSYKQGGAPFFIGLGLHFPHLSWATPQWTVDQYPNLPQPPLDPYAPKKCPPIAFTAELDGNTNLTINESNAAFATGRGRPSNVTGSVTYPCPHPGSNTVPEWFQQQLRLGYYSAVTHTDWLFGQVLQLLDQELGLANDTLVVVTGDHGWQLGEHAEWGKHTNWELALQVPLMIRAPWKAASVGRHTESPTELLDLYRTVASLAGLDSRVHPDVDGDDVSSVFDHPTQQVKENTFAQYSRCPGDRYWPKRLPGHPAWFLNNCESVPAENITSMGYTVRTSEWRYTEWFSFNNCRAQFNAPPLGVELYSHKGEPAHPVNFNKYENANLAGDPQYAAVQSACRKLLLEHFDIPTTRGLGCPPPLKMARSICNMPELHHMYDADQPSYKCISGLHLGLPCRQHLDCV